VAYVASLGDGPELPHVTRSGDVAVGGNLFRENCQACHSATGAGGALSYGRNAPPLLQAQRLQVGAAMRSGPGEMPRFGRDAFDDQDVDDIAAYVRRLRTRIEHLERGGSLDFELRHRSGPTVTG
jgi:ubiquinol-cytochrome c reductase cytochrome c subunit